MTPINLTLILSIIGNNLHTIRNARKETLQAVASDLGITHPVISQIENGRYENLKFNLLVKLCNHYNVPLNKIFSPDISEVFTTNNYQEKKHSKEKTHNDSTELLLNYLQNENQYLKEQNSKLINKITKTP